jgi:hypothetical protein
MKMTKNNPTPFACLEIENEESLTEQEEEDEQDGDEDRDGDRDGDRDDDRDGDRDDDRDGDRDGEDDINVKIQTYEESLERNLIKLKKKIDKSKDMNKDIIELFLLTLDDSYDHINEISTLCKRELVKDVGQKIYNLDKKLDRVYQMMDKYRDSICTPEGFRKLNRFDFLYEVDIYYNLFLCNLSKSKEISPVEYILCGLEYSSVDMLAMIDVVFYKDGHENERKRYETYLSILSKLKSIQLNQSQKDRLVNICRKNNQMLKYHEKLFKDV